MRSPFARQSILLSSSTWKAFRIQDPHRPGTAVRQLPCSCSRSRWHPQARQRPPRKLAMHAKHARTSIGSESEVPTHFLLSEVSLTASRTRSATSSCGRAVFLSKTWCTLSTQWTTCHVAVVRSRKHASPSVHSPVLILENP